MKNERGETSDGEKKMKNKGERLMERHAWRTREIQLIERRV